MLLRSKLIVAFIGHRYTDITPQLKTRLLETIESLIVNEKADTFLFGSKSEFNDICYETVTLLKNKYPHIKRIYVRGEYEYIHDDYRNYLLTLYEDTFYPAEVHNAGYRAYVKRNKVMIDMCDKLVVYYNERYRLKNRASGTEISVEYAAKKKKPICNIFKEL